MDKEKKLSFLVPLIAILLSLAAGAVLMLLLGKNPLQGYLSLLQGSGILPKANYAGGKGMLSDFMSFLDLLTPMIFAALAVAVALRAGLFNIGVSGQMLMSAFITSITIGYSPLPTVLAKPAVLIMCALIGALIGCLIGYLKYKFNINEVVSSIMLNYIFQYVISFFILTFFVNPVTRQSKNVSAAARLTLQDVSVGSIKAVIPLGFLVAVAAVVAVRYFMDRTRTGFEIKAVGANKRASLYVGINANRIILTAMGISGALAGLAGATYFLGYLGSIQPKVLPSIGFDGIAVCLLGNSSPPGIFAASFLITIISKGSVYLNSSLGVPREMSSLITGLMLLFAACGVFIRRILTRKKQK